MQEYNLRKYKNMPAEHKKIQLTFCTAADLDAIMTLQDCVYSVLQNQEIFVPTDREEINDYLKEGNIVLGCFDQTKLIAYADIIMPGLDIHNLGYDLGISEEKLPYCANFDSVIVHPDYRGNRLQQLLIGECEKAIMETPIKILHTTVSPQNPFSLNNFTAMGYEIKMRKLKYGGKDRYILQKTLGLV